MLAQFKNLAKNSAIYSLGNFSTKLAGFILLPLYTSYFSISEYGVIGILEVTSQLIVAVFGLGLYTALNRWYWEEAYRDKQKSIFTTALLFLGFIATLLVLLMFLFSQKLAIILFETQEYSYLLRLIALSAGLTVFGNIPLTLMRLQEKPILYSTSNLLRMTTSLLFTIYFIVNLKHGIASIYEAQILGHLVYFISISVYVIKNSTLKLNSNILKDMLLFSIPMIVASLSGILLTVADRYGLLYLASLSDAGIYSLAIKMINTVKVFVGQSVILALTPVLYKMMNLDNHKRFYSKTLTYFSFGILYFILGLSFFGKEIIHLVARNADYWPAYQLIPILGFAVLFDLMKNVASIGINITKKTKTTAVIIGVAALLNIGLNILLIPVFNTFGAALATVLSQFLVFVFIYRYAQKYYPVPYEILKIAKMIILAILFIVTVIFINNWSLTIRIVVKSCLLISFPISLYFFNFYEEIELIRTREFLNRIVKKKARKLK